MKTQVSPKTVLNLVENVLRSKKNAVTVMQGIYLKKGKAEIFITIGQVGGVSKSMLVNSVNREIENK